MDDRPAHVAPLHGDEPLGLEDPQRLTDGRQADPELLEQLVLLGEQGPIAQLTREDPTSERAGHHLGQARLAQLATQRSGDRHDI